MHWGGPGGPRGPRAPRGNVRNAILALLAVEPRNGYQLIQAIEEKSEGMWRPSAGAVYPALAQLEDEALIEAAGSGGSKRQLQLTDAGRSYVAEHADELHEPWAAAGDGVDEGR